MDDGRFIRMAGLWCIAGGLIAAVGAIITASVPPAVPLTNLSAPYTAGVFRVTEVLWTICHLFMFIGTLGFFRSGATGTSRLGQVGRWIAVVGMALVVPSELGFAFFADATMDSSVVMLLSSAIGLASTVAALGFVLAGIAVLRADRWQGWHRFIPLVCGMVVFVALIPIQAISPELFLWPVALWSASFVPLGLALYQQVAVQGHLALASVTG